MSDKGYMSLAPGDTQPGNYICLLLGVHVFSMLRPAGESWSSVGECYADEFVGDEAMSLLVNGTFEFLEFMIV